MKDNIEKNITLVRQKIARAAVRRGDNVGAIDLIAVSKNVPVEKINAAICAGITDIGENRVQEAREKWESISDQVKWHFIGHLQRNKVKYVLDRFHLIHSLDRVSLAEELQKRAARLEVIVSCLVQVNVAGEKSKFGIPPMELAAFLRRVSVFSHVRICGLMTIAPYCDDAERARPIFRRLRKIFEDVGNHPPQVTMKYLSMGMSSDFEVAVEEGANMVRVGTAIFGRRAAAKNTVEG